MPAEWRRSQGIHSLEDRKVRVFISSTFRDMHAERDHLVTVVFPELRERIEKLGLEFYDVDLRWGVPTRDANGETANSWEYCRQWIDRVEPFFICVLGQRYGHRPEPGQLRDPAEQARQQAQRRSITELEVRHAVLSDRRKRRSYFYLRETVVSVLSPGANVAERVAYDEFVDPPEQLAQLDALKGEIRACGRPVRGYTCRWTGKDFADLDKAEKQFGPLVLEDLWSGVLRDERYVSKEVWRQELNADPDGDSRYTDESQPVPRELWERIVARAKPEPPSPLVAEQQQMEGFAQSRLRWFQGRANELRQLMSFLHDTTAEAPRVAVVVAVPGQGKSALLAKLWETARGDQSPSERESDPFIIAHFVGVTERSASAHNLVERLLGELDRSGISWPTEAHVGQEAPRDFNTLCFRLAQRLGDYAGPRRITILLDALNQLSDGQDLHWLPTRLGPGVRVIASCVAPSPPSTPPAGERVIDDQERENADRPTADELVLRALDSRGPAQLRVPLGELTGEDVRAIVIEYLHEYCHELDSEHLDTLAAVPQARNPLYLLVMLNELRTLGGNDLNRIVPALIASMSRAHPDTVSLFRWVLQRMEVFNKDAPDAVRWWCLYLAHGRVGMASHELADLLARKVGAHAAATALRIERGLRRYLQRRGPQLDFFHSQLREAVAEEYRPSHEAQLELHSSLADYFSGQADPTGDRTWASPVGRPFLELPWHLHRAGRNIELRELLFHFTWLYRKLEATAVSALVEDYEYLLEENEVRLTQGAILLSAQIADRDKSQLGSQLVGRLRRETTTQIRQLVESVCAWRGATWLQPLNANLPSPGTALLRTFRGHSGTVTGVALRPDGHGIVSSSGDKTVKVWDLRTGLESRTLRGHTNSVNDLALTPDGRKVVSASADHTVKVWDLRSGTELLTFRGHSKSVNAVAVTPNGLQVVSGSSDRTLKLWDLNTGQELRTFTGHADSIFAVAVSQDARRVVSAANDQTIGVWDMDNGRLLRSLGNRRERHEYDPEGGFWDSQELTAMAVTTDGHKAVAGSEFGELKIWDLDDGQLLQTIEGDRGHIYAVSLLPTAPAAVTGSGKALKIWNLAEGQVKRTIKGHNHAVRALAVSTEGRSVVSGSEDTTLKLWDLHSEREDSTQGHPLGVAAITITPDGRSVVSIDGSFEPADSVIKVWDLRGAEELRAFGVGQVNEIALTPDSRRVVSVSDDGGVRLWDLETGAQVWEVIGHKDRVLALALTGDGRRAVSAADDDIIKVWDLEQRRQIGAIDPEPGRLRNLVLSPNGEVVLACSEGPVVHVYGVKSGRRLQTLEGHDSWVLEVALTPDGLRAVTASHDHTLKVWDVKYGRMLQTLHGHTDIVSNVAILPGATQALSSSNDGTLKLWSLESGQVRHTLTGHKGLITSMAVMPDGYRVASTGTDETLRIWDLRTGECLCVFTGEDAMRCCAVASDPCSIVAGEGSGRIHFLRLMLPDERAQ